jgi:hypothetical protein
MLRDAAHTIQQDSVVAINRYIEMGLVYFNTIVALMLLTAPWYLVENDTTFNGCVISEGTVIAPFLSKFCGKELATLPGAAGKDWKTLHVFVWVYFALALLSSAIIGYEFVHNGVRKWSNASTIGFCLQVCLIVFQSLVLVESDSAVKPDGVDDSTARILVITAIVLSSLRIATLGFFMYVTRKYAPMGRFGTGSSVY